MGNPDSVAQLHEQGVVLLRNIFPADSLAILKDAAIRCFDTIANQPAIPPHFRFNPYSHSVLVAALADFGCPLDNLLAPLSAPGLAELFTEAMRGHWSCNMNQSWVRNKFAQQNAPSREYYQQGWHQDGALGVHFPLEPGPVIPMTELITCWIPLNPCGKDSPGLELIRCPQPSLLHFTQLDDAALRVRFEPHQFWAPELELGDGLVFLNSILHRTYARPEMQQNRLSVEYRIFPAR